MLVSIDCAKLDVYTYVQYAAELRWEAREGVIFDNLKPGRVGRSGNVRATEGIRFAVKRLDDCVIVFEKQLIKSLIHPPE